MRSIQVWQKLLAATNARSTSTATRVLPTPPRPRKCDEPATVEKTGYCANFTLTTNKSAEICRQIVGLVVRGKRAREKGCLLDRKAVQPCRRSPPVYQRRCHDPWTRRPLGLWSRGPARSSGGVWSITRSADDASFEVLDASRTQSNPLSQFLLGVASCLTGSGLCKAARGQCTHRQFRPGRQVYSSLSACACSIW
jgi:hypothetical protein